VGHSRRFVRAASTSVSPSIPDVFRRRSERSKRAKACKGIHSALMPVALIIGHHFSISAFCSCASASGVC
jgi:hypothetical protein